MARYVNLVAGAAALAAIATASPAGAAQVFFDDFEGDTTMLNNSNLVKWNVTNGSIDIVEVPNSFVIVCAGGTGKCLDTDGTTSPPQAGTIVSKTTFGAGTYQLKFDLSGNQRGNLGYGSDTVKVSFGAMLLDTITLAPDVPFTTFSYIVTGPGAITFQGLGGDNVGLVLDNVQLAAVPEPGTLAIMSGSLAAFGLLRRRRRAS